MQIDLALEHRALLLEYGRVQTRCSAQLRAQAAEIGRLVSQAMRLRAEVVVRDTALAWGVGMRIDDERARAPTRLADAARLEASLVAADLVICQTGCASHGDYWRVEDHCRRTGKTCVLVDRPDALRIVRIAPDGDGDAMVASHGVRVI